MIVLTQIEKEKFITLYQGNEFDLVKIGEKFFQPIAIKENLFILPEDSLLEGIGIKREVNENELITE